MKSNINVLAGMGLAISLLAGTAIAQTSPPPATSAPPQTPPTGQTAAPAQTPPTATSTARPVKVGVIDLQAAIVQTKDGQKAATDLKTKFTPKQSELEKKQQDIAALQNQLRSGQNTLSEENKQKLMREIDQKNTILKRDTEDANADLEQEQQRIMADLIPKIISVLNKYATDNGFALVLDISSQQTPILFASNTIDLTREIIALYDKSAPNFQAPPKTNVAPAPATKRPGDK